MENTEISLDDMSGEVENLSQVVDFKDLPVKNYCSLNICKNDHSWVPTVAVGKCPGCGSPTLAIKMENCPICNEPVVKMNLRSDHLPKGGRVDACCQNEPTHNEVIFIKLVRNHAEDVETEKYNTTRPSGLQEIKNA